ncbi:MAG: MFS transporter [Proteobacteria bacterium]|nr:MFS transporter [Pseudomonadota bacterium]
MHILQKKNLAVIIGNALEYYDFMLYGFFAFILAPLFFPTDNPSLSLIASMGSYGVGFLARPLGGIFFGHLGDRWGRKDTLSLSILLVSIPTIGIACLPSYEHIGMWAPLLLVFFRILQGFCLGGETSGAITYFIENAKPNEKDIASSWIVLSCYVGTLAGTILGSIFTLSFMPSWGWRITFVIGSLIAVIGYYIRQKLKETPEFIACKKQGKILKIPLIELLKNEKTNLFLSSCVSSAVIIPFFIIFIYLNGLMKLKFQLEAPLLLLLNAGLMIFWILLLPVFGFLSQTYGRKKVMQAGLLGLSVFSYPLFLLVSSVPSLESILLTQIILSIFAMAFSAPSSAFLVELFPVAERFSGIAFGYSLGHAIFGGLTPILLTTLVQAYEFTHAPVLFLVFCSLLGSLALQKPSFFARHVEATQPLT